jgi:hypothetical protein
VNVHDAEGLAAPFSRAQIDWRCAATSRDGTRALLRPEVQLSAIVERLDTVIGSSNWSDRYQALPNGFSSCRLTVHGDYHDAVSDGGSDAKGEALRNAALKFGVARHLSRISGVWVDWDAVAGQPLETPVLPSWAVAETPRCDAS